MTAATLTFINTSGYALQGTITEAYGGEVYMMHKCMCKKLLDYYLSINLVARLIDWKHHLFILEKAIFLG